MARGTAICRCKTCGKEFVKYGYNKSSRREADEWEAWAASHYDKCDDCWRAEKAAAEAEADAQLAPITEGSEKQIAWAVKIRANARKGLEKLAKLDDITDVYLAFMPWVLNSHTDARWWIDHRYELSSVDELSFRTGEFLGDLLDNYAKDHAKED